MSRLSRGKEQGAAIIDLIFFCLALQVPIILFAADSAQTQHRAFALEAVARHGLRAHLLHPSEEHTAAVISQIWSQYGLADEDLEIEWSCHPDPSCESEDSLIFLEVKSGSQLAISAASAVG